MFCMRGEPCFAAIISMEVNSYQPSKMVTAKKISSISGAFPFFAFV